MSLEQLAAIVNIFSILLVILFIYYSIIIGVRLIVNRKFDIKFGIRTQGRISSKIKKYNRTESTPYLALFDLHKKYEIDRNKGIVDFGSGLGRAAFVMNNLYGNQVTGVEANEDVFDRANYNLKKYLEKNPNEGNIKFENVIAEEYVIKEDEEVFFFFNSFDVDIFKRVVKNIEEDAEKTGKKPIIILYYPTLPFVYHIYYSTRFRLEKTFEVYGSLSKSERFSIYKYK